MDGGWGEWTIMYLILQQGSVWVAEVSEEQFEKH